MRSNQKKSDTAKKKSDDDSMKFEIEKAHNAHNDDILNIDNIFDDHSDFSTQYEINNDPDAYEFDDYFDQFQEHQSDDDVSIHNLMFNGITTDQTNSQLSESDPEEIIPLQLTQHQSNQQQQTQLIFHPVQTNKPKRGRKKQQQQQQQQQQQPVMPLDSFNEYLSEKIKSKNNLEDILITSKILLNVEPPYVEDFGERWILLTREEKRKKERIYKGLYKNVNLIHQTLEINPDRYLRCSYDVIYNKYTKGKKKK